MLFATDSIAEMLKTWPGAAFGIVFLLFILALVYIVNNPRKP